MSNMSDVAKELNNGLLENAKGKIYSALYAKYGQREITSLEMNNFVIEQLSEQRVMIGTLSLMFTDMLKKLGGLQNDERDEQADATQTTQGGDGASANNVGVQ